MPVGKRAVARLLLINLVNQSIDVPIVGLADVKVLKQGAVFLHQLDEEVIQFGTGGFKILPVKAVFLFRLASDPVDKVESSTLQQRNREVVLRR